MVGNPEHWLCEGAVSRDQSGNPVWTFSGSNTTSPPWPVAGEPIDIYQCDTSAGAWNNNVDDHTIDVPQHGYGALTSPCVDGVSSGQVFGPKRVCEMTPTTPFATCTPGQTVSLTCTIPDTAKSQVMRVCEASNVLHAGTACRYNDDFTLANVVVQPGVATEVTFKCPTQRFQDDGVPDASEIGGAYAIYSGAVYNGGTPTAPITCV
jgi:hypothetical protein